MQIETTGDLRKFLGEVLVGIRDGSIDRNKAEAIAKVASQMNMSLSVEVNATIQFRRLGDGPHVPGSMLLTKGAVVETPVPQLKAPDQDGMIWCDQCDMRVSVEDATGCKSKHCKARA